MQDPNSGLMHKLPDGIGDLLRQVQAPVLPVFKIGEVIELRGGVGRGRFRVAAIGSRFMRLERLAGHAYRERIEVNPTPTTTAPGAPALGAGRA